MCLASLIVLYFCSKLNCAETVIEVEWGPDVLTCDDKKTTTDDDKGDIKAKKRANSKVVAVDKSVKQNILHAKLSI